MDFNIINTNARSLRPKIPSLIDYFRELDLTFAVVTETWFATGKNLEIESENLLLGSGIKLTTRNRTLVNGLAHGGVAVLSRDATTTIKTCNYDNFDNYEVLPVEAKVQGLEKKVFIIATYIPPSYPVARGRGCLSYLNDIVLDIKRKNDSPWICVTGDFNQWQVGEELEDFPDLCEVLTLPTRNERRIDRIFLNWHDHLVESGCLPPLETEDLGNGRTFSDHKVQYCFSKLPRKPPVVWEKIVTRPFRKENAQPFRRDLERESWKRVVDASGVNAKEREFQAVIDRLMDKHFPTKVIKRKDDDLPWYDDEARKRSKKKKAVFKVEGRSPRWCALRDNLDKYLLRRSESYLERQTENLTKPEADKQFHRYVKNYKSGERPKTFNVRELLPDRSDREVAEEISRYFNEISQEFEPLQPHQVPTTYEKHLPLLSSVDVVGRIKKQKKPNSMVVGDIFPKLLNSCAEALAYPLALIYNEIILCKVWPIAWKKEYVTVIPKKRMPEGLKDLRNISCTRFFSKVFESYMLQNILEEIEIKSNQFGGVKGCSTGHMLVEIWQQICENAEDYRCGTVLAAIDYAKAFNRLSFQHCMESFRRKGASTSVIRIVASFLTNRSMTVKIGNEWSSPKQVNGGCPQGSILGVLLFNLTTDDLEDNFLEGEKVRLGHAPAELLAADKAPRPPRPAAGLATSSPVAATIVPTSPGLSPVATGFYKHDGQEVSFIEGARNCPVIGLDQDGQVTIEEERPVGTQVLVKKPVLIVKYIDDCVSCEKLNFADVEIKAAEEGPIKEKQAKGTQNAFRSTTRNAVRKNMKVNEEKTNIICVSDALNYVPRTYILDNAEKKIESKEEMRVLGFDFSNKPTVHKHVEGVLGRLRRKYWILYHLQRLGLTRPNLVKVYLSQIVPIADYCDYVYHSLLTDELDERLEKAQVGALRVIFGPGISGRKLREMAGVKTLRNRRIEHADRFAQKAAASNRFARWFPKRVTRRSSRPGADVYVEEYARCDRLRFSPIHYMRRRLNGKPGKSYGERYRIYRER